MLVFTIRYHRLKWLEYETRVTTERDRGRKVYDIQALEVALKDAVG